MKFCYCSFLLLFLFLRKTSAGIVRKPPAFATPVYSDAYIPASMQVIFHAVDQLKHLEMEDLVQEIMVTSSTSPHPPGQHQPLPTIRSPDLQMSSIKTPYQGEPKEQPELSQEQPEVEEEEREIVFGTPETNYEIPEKNQEEPEKLLVVENLENKMPPCREDGQKSTKANSELSGDVEGTFPVACSSTSGDSSGAQVTKPSVDSVVKEIYGIVKPSSQEEENLESKNAHEESDEEDHFEGKEEEKRFAHLGERVSQVPQPSLVTYLRKTKVTPKASLRQLAELYDALSKDARKQGLSKFFGYSEAVLKTLEGTSEGGVGPQLKLLLEKALERNELTRADAKERVKTALKDLEEPGSSLSTALRRLVPLRFML